MLFMIIGIIVVASLLTIIISMMFRVVVETNKVHIVQSKKQTTSYGTGQSSGNAYYKWPRWVPVIGVTRIILPVNNFDLNLHGYKAYDKDRVPFELDLTAFFRIADTNKAAERIANFEDLAEQLQFIVQGAARKILASHDIHQIMLGRATFGEQFTTEVKGELASWGVEPVKNMELMDIRDSDGSRVIANIMAQKSSQIEMNSRVEVANNLKMAEVAEIEARRTIDISTQEAEQQVGQRTADKDKAVGIANQRAMQEIAVEEALTTQKKMDVLRIDQVRQAEIKKEAAVVQGEQDKQVAILEAEGGLQSTKLKSEGIRVEGEAIGSAEQAKLMAPVKAQVELAREIGENKGYQQYLVSLKAIEAYVVVGGKQAEALGNADVKVIANASKVTSGAKSVMQLFNSDGGTELGAMLEGLSQVPQGAAFLENIGNIAAGFFNPEKKNDANSRDTTNTFPASDIDQEKL